MARGNLYPPSVDPGFPVLPETPLGWTRATFGDALDVVERRVSLSPGRTYRLVNAKRNRGGVVLRGELLGNEILTKTQFEAKADDFLISRRQIIHGACGIVPLELDGAVVSNEYSTLRVRDSLALDFLRHFCHTPYFQRTCFHSSHGVDVEKMIFKINEWLVREVDLPPLPEQRKIAAILSSVDEAIESAQAVIEQLRVVKKAMMAELLTRGIPGRHTKFKMTEIGEVPEAWEVTNLGAICIEAPRYGANVSKGPFQPGGIRYVRITDILPDGSLESDEVVGIEREAGLPYLLQTGDIVFARSGATVGKSYVYSSADGPCAHAGYLVRFRPDPSRLSVNFLGQLAQTERYWRWIRDSQRAQAQPNINASEYSQMLIPLPPVSEQQETVEGLSHMDTRLRSEKSHAVALYALKSALMSVLLTGEVRVKLDESVA